MALCAVAWCLPSSQDHLPKSPAIFHHGQGVTAKVIECQCPRGGSILLTLGSERVAVRWTCSIVRQLHIFECAVGGDKMTCFPFFCNFWHPTPVPF